MSKDTNKVMFQSVAFQIFVNENQTRFTKFYFLVAITVQFL